MLLLLLFAFVLIKWSSHNANHCNRARQVNQSKLLNGKWIWNGRFWLKFTDCLKLVRLYSFPSLVNNTPKQLGQFYVWYDIFNSTRLHMKTALFQLTRDIVTAQMLLLLPFLLLLCCFSFIFIFFCFFPSFYLLFMFMSLLSQKYIYFSN